MLGSLLPILSITLSCMTVVRFDGTFPLTVADPVLRSKELPLFVRHEAIRPKLRVLQTGEYQVTVGALNRFIYLP